MSSVTGIPADRLVAAHIRLEAEKSLIAAVAKKLTDALNADIAILETTLLGMLKDQGQDNFKACGKIVSKFEDVNPSAEDWSKIYKFIAAENAWEMLGRKVGKTWTNKYAKEHGGALPPGVKVHREWKVKIVAAPKKTDDVVGGAQD